MRDRPHHLPRDLAIALRRAREVAGLTREQVGAATGKSVRACERWERAKRVPMPQTLLILRSLYDLDDDLFAELRDVCTWSSPAASTN